jgi:hypothetical protein
VPDLCRTRGDMVQDRMRARHRLSKLLLGHGRVWRDGKAWTLAHERWLLSQRFAEPALQTTYDHYRAVLLSRDAQPEAIQADLAVWQDRAPFRRAGGPPERLPGPDPAWRPAPGCRGRRLGPLRQGEPVHGLLRAGAKPILQRPGDPPGPHHKAGNLHLRPQLARVGLGLPAPPQCRRPARPTSAGLDPRWWPEPGPPSCGCVDACDACAPPRARPTLAPPPSPGNWPGSCGRDGGLTTDRLSC